MSGLVHREKTWHLNEGGSGKERWKDWQANGNGYEKQFRFVSKTIKWLLSNKEKQHGEKNKWIPRQPPNLEHQKFITASTVSNKKIYQKKYI